MFDYMTKKETTRPFPIRLPESVIERLGKAADKKYESKAGLAARIVIEWLEENEPKLTRAKPR